MNHSNSHLDRRFRRMGVDSISFKYDAAFIWIINTSEDIHQRAFPSAILSNQRMNLPRVQL